MIKRDRKSLIIIAIIIITLFSIVSVAKYGSNTVYFFVAAAMCCLAVPPIIVYMSDHKKPKKNGLYKTITVSFFLVLLIYGELYNSATLLYPTPSNSYQGIIGSYVRNISGNVLIESPYIAAAAGKNLIFETSIFWVLQKADLWNDSLIVNSVCKRNFSAVVFQEPGRNTFTYYTGLMNAINESYHLNATISGWRIYTPDASSSC